VLEGISPLRNKVLSLSSRIHGRSLVIKAGALVEFGRHVMLDEADGGSSRATRSCQHPNEHGQAIDAVQHNQTVSSILQPADWRPRRALPETETRLRRRASSGGRSGLPANFRKNASPGNNAQLPARLSVRAGIEGRIASLRRDYGGVKVLHGQEGMERWLGLAFFRKFAGGRDRHPLDARLLESGFCLGGVHAAVASQQLGGCSKTVW